MQWLWVVLVGLVVGALAKLIMPGKDPGGFIVTILLGIAGSVIATWLGRAIGWWGSHRVHGGSRAAGVVFPDRPRHARGDA